MVLLDKVPKSGTFRSYKGTEGDLLLLNGPKSVLNIRIVRWGRSRGRTIVCLTRVRDRLVGYGSNNLIITRHPVKVSPVKQGSMINIGKRQEPVPRVNPTQTASLDLAKVHNLKSSLVKLLRVRNSILGIGLKPMNLAIVVIIPLMNIQPLVLIAALCNCLAKNELGLSGTPSSIQDRKYNSESLGTFRLSSRANKEQARIH